MPPKNDRDLLKRYTETRCDESFRLLVERYIYLVHSVANRVTRNPDLARDVAQLVFTRLAHQPTRVPSGIPLPAWLHRTTRSTAANLVRGEERRKRRDLNAAIHHAMKTDPTWQDLEPSIDTLIDQLPQRERAALVLRFYSGHSHSEVGRALGISEDAARKRIARSLEKLRHLLSKRGIATTTAFLSSILPARAIGHAPEGLAHSVSSAALASTGNGALASGAAAILAMTTKTKLAITAALAAMGLATYTYVATTDANKSGSTPETASAIPSRDSPGAEIRNTRTARTERTERPSKRIPHGEIDAETWEMAGAFLSMVRSAPPESLVRGDTVLKEKDLENLRRQTDFDEGTMEIIARLNAEYLDTKQAIAVEAYEQIERSKDVIQEAIALGMLSEKTPLSEETQQHLDQLHEHLDEDFEEPLKMMEDLKAWHENEELLDSIRGELTTEQTPSFDRFVKERSDIATEGWAFQRSQTLAEKLHLDPAQRQAVFEELYQKREEDPDSIRELLNEDQNENYTPNAKKTGTRTFSFGFSYGRN